jgi:hypothetical protein
VNETTTCHPRAAAKPLVSEANETLGIHLAQRPVILRKGFCPQSQNPVVKCRHTLPLDSAMPLCGPQNDRDL